MTQLTLSSAPLLVLPDGLRTTKYSGPLVAGGLLRVSVWVVHVCQPPVPATVRLPTSVPVGDPARTWIVPPAVAEATRKVMPVTLVRLPASYDPQSPSSMDPMLLTPPCGSDVASTTTPALPVPVLSDTRPVVAKNSACLCWGCRITCPRPVSEPLPPEPPLSE